MQQLVLRSDLMTIFSKSVVIALTCRRFSVPHRLPSVDATNLNQVNMQIKSIDERLENREGHKFFDFKRKIRKLNVPNARIIRTSVRLFRKAPSKIRTVMMIRDTTKQLRRTQLSFSVKLAL